MGILKSIFTWWDGPTIGTRIFTRMNGEEVGRDGAGNVYFRSKDNKKPGRRERRWVIYQGDNEASRVPPEWHGWLHYTHHDVPDADAERRPWVREHRPNATGTGGAYLRPGALPTQQARPKTLGDYESWTPDDVDEEAAR